MGVFSNAAADYQKRKKDQVIDPKNGLFAQVKNGTYKPIPPFKTDQPKNQVVTTPNPSPLQRVQQVADVASTPGRAIGGVLNQIGSAVGGAIDRAGAAVGNFLGSGQNSQKQTGTNAILPKNPAQNPLNQVSPTGQPAAQPTTVPQPTVAKTPDKQKMVDNYLNYPSFFTNPDHQPIDKPISADQQKNQAWAKFWANPIDGAINATADFVSSSPEALKTLANIQNSVDGYLKKNPNVTKALADYQTGPVNRFFTGLEKGITGGFLGSSTQVQTLLNRSLPQTGKLSDTAIDTVSAGIGTLIALRAGGEALAPLKVNPKALSTALFVGIGQGSLPANTALSKRAGVAVVNGIMGIVSGSLPSGAKVGVLNPKGLATLAAQALTLGSGAAAQTKLLGGSDQEVAQAFAIGSLTGTLLHITSSSVAALQERINTPNLLQGERVMTPNDVRAAAAGVKNTEVAQALGKLADTAEAQGKNVSLSAEGLKYGKIAQFLGAKNPAAITGVKFVDPTGTLKDPSSLTQVHPEVDPTSPEVNPTSSGVADTLKRNNIEALHSSDLSTIIDESTVGMLKQYGGKEPVGPNGKIAQAQVDHTLLDIAGKSSIVLGQDQAEILSKLTEAAKGKDFSSMQSIKDVATEALKGVTVETKAPATLADVSRGEPVSITGIKSALERGDIAQARSILSQIPTSDPFYGPAKDIIALSDKVGATSPAKVTGANVTRESVGMGATDGLVNKDGVDPNLPQPEAIKPVSDAVKAQGPTSSGEDNAGSLLVGSNYQGPHRIDTTASRPASAVQNLEQIVSDVKSKYGLTKFDQKDIAKLQKIQGTPEADVTIYRASPKNEINVGDWVTTSKQYAQDIQSQNGGQVYSYTVKAKDLAYPNDVGNLPSLARFSTFAYNPKTVRLTNGQTAQKGSTSRQGRVSAQPTTVNATTSQALRQAAQAARTPADFIRQVLQPSGDASKYIQKPTPVPAVGSDGIYLVRQGMGLNGVSLTGETFHFTRTKPGTPGELVRPISHPARFNSVADFQSYRKELAKKLGVDVKRLQDLGGNEDILKAQGFDGIVIGQGKAEKILRFTDKPSVATERLTKIHQEANTKLRPDVNYFDAMTGMDELPLELSRSTPRFPQNEPKKIKSAPRFGLPAMIQQEVAPGVSRTFESVQAIVGDLLSSLAPASRSKLAQETANIFRHRSAQVIRRQQLAMNASEKRLEQFSRKSNEDNLAFITDIETGNLQGDPVKMEYRRRFDFAGELVRAVNPNFNPFIENYFSHMWEQPNRATKLLLRPSRRPLQGSKSFLKRRTIPTYAEGVSLGLTPVSYNPEELLLMHEFQVWKYVMAHDVFNEMKRRGLTKFYKFGQDHADLVKLDDSIANVYRPATIPADEFVDKQMYEGLTNFAARLGIKYSRTASLGLGKGKEVVGVSVVGRSEIRIKHDTPLSIIAHEIGHQLDEKFHIGERVIDKTTRPELEKLANLRVESTLRPNGTPEIPSQHLKYIYSKEELIANLMDMYVTNRPRLQKVAPKTYAKLDGIISVTPQLFPLTRIEHGVELKRLERVIDLHGMIKTGEYYAPPEVARIFNNYLSPGLARVPAYRAVRYFANVVNMFQLGLSAFHLGFVSLDAAMSDLALAFRQLSEGNPKGLLSAGRGLVFASPVASYTKGLKLYRKYNNSFSGDPIIEAFVRGGGRVHMDTLYKNNALQTFLKRVKEKKYLTAAITAPSAIVEAFAMPLMEHVVPMMKLGAFANIAEFELSKNPGMEPLAMRRVMGEAWDTVDDRLGQIAYDNLFWNRALKDLGLISVRSLGWNLGTFRQIGGGTIDLIKQLKNLFTGKGFKVTNKMGYLFALPMIATIWGAVYYYLHTGDRPKEWRDYFFPKDGRLLANGKPERVSLPTYMKDLYEYTQDPLTTVEHKLNPLLGIVGDMLNNHDFYGTQVRNPGSPIVMQAAQLLGYAFSQLQPFSSRATTPGQIEPDLQRRIEQFLGIAKAPASVNLTPGERAMNEIFDSRSQPVVTQAQNKINLERQQARSDIHSGKTVNYDQLVKDGVVTKQGLKTFIADAKLSSLQRSFKSLSTAEQIQVWPKLSDSEKKSVAKQIHKDAQSVLHP